MKVIVHPADQGGCGHYRLIWASEVLIAEGYDVELAYDYEYLGVWQPCVIGGDRIIDLARDVEADVVVMQRPLHRNRVELIDVLQAKGIAVVVELDDDFHSIHPMNVAWRGTNPLHDRESNRDWLKRACERADLVTVSTPALAERYGTHGRVRVLPNYIPERYLDTVSTSHEGIVVGWSGSIATHPKDLQVTQGAIGEVLSEAGASFAVVGTGVKVQEALGLAEPVNACGWVPIEEYPQALAHFDAGIVPLLPSAFNEAKSWLKGLEMAAVGVPFVASSTEQYRTLAQMGAGLIAPSRAAWAGHLRRLLSHGSFRVDKAEQGRAVAREMTIEKHAGEWMEAWSDALAYRRGERAA